MTVLNSCFSFLGNGTGIKNMTEAGETTIEPTSEHWFKAGSQCL